jgi:hypothetical protein
MADVTDDLLERAPGEPAEPAPDDSTADTPATGIDRPSPSEPLARRIVRRVFRRPLAWIDAPWTTARIVRVVTTVVLVGGSTWAALKVVHPTLVLSNNTPTGGDMGAHVMGPAFLRDHLLSNFQLSGWNNYWYAGFPMYRFYMVTPALLIVLLNVVLPYGIAFKIVAVSGIVTLPLCCWAFGRLARFRHPIPELMAVAGLLFLFDESFSIYGGNVKSTMAGEFAFSMALSLAMLAFGVLARGLETGKYRVWAAVLLALACLTHGIVLIFVALGAILMVLVWADKTRLWYGVTTGVTTFLLAAFWVVPFLFNHDAMTDMKYGYRPDGAADSFWDMFFPLTTFFDIFITGFAAVGFIAAVARRHLTGAWLGILHLALVAGVYVTRDSLPVIGLLWNPRLLPFVYITRYLLMMIGIVELAYAIARGVKARELTSREVLRVGTATAAVVGIGVLCIQLMFFRTMPGASMQTHNGKQVYQWGPISLTPTSTRALSDAWARYNFTGYEDKDAYGEYRSLVLTMDDLRNDPTAGCGRALWENNSENGKYGTTMALMLLPHWTDGCIASMEGLFFEASGTTPYHFLAASAMSENSSDPVRELRYTKNNGAIGVPYLQSLGVRYVMVFTEAAKREADLQPELTLIRQSGPWNIYQVSGTDLVEPLEFQPVVVNERGGDQRERKLELGTSWFQNRGEWAAMPADGGPDEWQRIDVITDTTRIQDGRVDIVVPEQPIEQVPLPPVNVSNVVLGEQDLRFTVDQIGVPVLVKVSWFPNWQVSGAEGPWRIAPNMMVVVPTSTEVHLTFERSGLDIVAYLMTLLGIGLCVLWRIRGDVQHATPSPLVRRPLWDDDPDADDGDGDGRVGRDPWGDRDAVDETVPIVRVDPFGADPDPEPGWPGRSLPMGSV